MNKQTAYCILAKLNFEITLKYNDNNNNYDRNFIKNIDRINVTNCFVQ